MSKTETIPGLLRRRFEKAQRRHDDHMLLKGRSWHELQKGFGLAELGEIRAKNGVGRPPAETLARLARQGWRVVHRTDGSGARWSRFRPEKPGPAERRRRRRFQDLTTWKAA